MGTSSLMIFKNRVAQIEPVLIDRGHLDAQFPLHICQRDVVQKHVLPVAEHVDRKQQPFPQLPTSQLRCV